MVVVHHTAWGVQDTLCHHLATKDRKFWQCHKYRMTVSHCHLCCDILLLSNQLEYRRKWHRSWHKTSLFTTVAVQMDDTLKTFFSCMLTCVIAWDAVGVTIIQSTYMTVDVVPKSIRSMSHSVTALNLKIAEISVCQSIWITSSITTHFCWASLI